MYEYECPTDGRFERIQKFSDPPLRICPSCGRPVEKLVAAPAIHFKGSGWYITDYARKSNGKNAPDGADTTKAGASSGASESASEAKPAASASTEKPSASTSSTPSSSPSTKSTPKKSTS